MATYTNFPNTFTWGQPATYWTGSTQLANVTTDGSAWTTWVPTGCTTTTIQWSESTGGGWMPNLWRPPVSLPAAYGWTAPHEYSITHDNGTITYRATYQYPFVFTVDHAAAAPANRIREMIRRRLAPPIVGSRRPAPTCFDERESRARDTLRRVVGEDRYRRFLRDGCISVRARSGRTYVVGHGMTRVYDKGRQVDILCVVLKGDFPPTDALITRFLMILNDEAGFVALANRSGPGYRSPRVARAPISLVEETRQLKRA